MPDDSHIQFDTDDQAMQAASHAFTSRSVLSQSEVPGMAAWLIKKGIIKDESNAKGILVGIVIVNFLIAASVFYFFVVK